MTVGVPDLDAGLAAWCERVVGPFRLEPLPAAGGGRSAGRGLVVGLRTPSLLRVLKVPVTARGAQAERWAYREWAPVLGDEAPRLVAYREGAPPALILTAMDGHPAPDDGTAWRPATLRRAGAALARLHGVALPAPADADGAAVDHVSAVLEDWLGEGLAAGALDAEEVALARAALDDVACFSGEPGVACHGDYRPANWLVDGAGGWVGMVDFEHSRLGPAALDVTAFWDATFGTNPELGAAFLDGYGRRAGDERRLRIGRVAAALARVVGGTMAGAAEPVAAGRSALRALARSWS